MFAHLPSAIAMPGLHSCLHILASTDQRSGDCSALNSESYSPLLPRHPSLFLPRCYPCLWACSSVLALCTLSPTARHIRLRSCFARPFLWSRGLIGCQTNIHIFRDHNRLVNSRVWGRMRVNDGSMAYYFAFQSISAVSQHRGGTSHELLFNTRSPCSPCWSGLSQASLAKAAVWHALTCESTLEVQNR